MTTIAERIEQAQYDIEDAYVAHAEHRAFNECYQFDGDTCPDCDDADREWERLGMRLSLVHQEDRRNAIYNRTYARAIRTLRTPVSENLLLTAHAFARRHTEEVLRGGRTCGNCAGTGIFSLKNARSAETGVYTPAVCFGCHGAGRQTDADRIRNRVYWDKYARITA